MDKYKNPLMNSDGGGFIRGFFVSLFPLYLYFLLSFSFFRILFYLISLLISPGSL